MDQVTSALNQGEAATRRSVRQARASRSRRMRVGRWAALTLVAGSLAILPTGANASYDVIDGGTAGHPAQAAQFPTAKQIAQHRGMPPGAALSADVPASGGNGDTLLIVLAGAGLLGVTGVAAVATAGRVRARRTPQPSV
jgi:hypothetical protein